MAPANRLPGSDIRKFAIATLVVSGVFLLCCGAGASNVVIGGLGVLLAIGGPMLIMLFNYRSTTRRYVFGTAHVHEIGPLPSAGTFGRTEMELVINARGIDGVPVRVRDSAVPVSKWPDVGATLPVRVVAGNPRKVTILWDEVRTHGELALAEQGYTPSDPNDPATDPRLDHGPLPPDDSPVTGIPMRTSFVEPPEDTEADRVDGTDGNGDGGGDTQPGDRETDLPLDRPLIVTRLPSTPTPRTTPHRRPSPKPVPSPRRSTRDTGGAPVATMVSSLASPYVYSIPEAGTAGDAAPATAPVSPVPTSPPPPTTDSWSGPPADTVLEVPRELPEPVLRDVVVRDPADELEPEPLGEGGIGQFLAATPRRSAPLAGVNGVSITLNVSDLQRSRRFYRDTIGLSELDSSPTSAVLASGDARVVLRRVADMPPVDRRVVHLNLEVPDVYEAYDRLRAAGVEFVHRPRVIPQGEQLELCSATFRDPDGHAIALTRWELRR